MPTPVKNFAPVTLVSVSPPLLLVHPSVPVKSVKELIALAKAQPGKLAYRVGRHRLAAALRGRTPEPRSEDQDDHVPYKGAAPALIDLVGGHVPVA
jgi:tripartite-type tricarboxylate transporter receptor subunit TctC